MKKENKRKFNIFFSILTCFIITLACLSPCFNSYAWSDFDMIEMLDIQDTYITASDLGDGNYNYFVQDTTYEQTYHDIYSQGFNYHANDSVSSQLNSLDFNRYVASFKSDYSSLYLFYLPENSFVVQNQNSARIFAEIEYSDIGAGSNAAFPVYSASTGSQSSTMWQTIGYGTTVDDSTYSVIDFSDSYGTANHICSLNIPVYYYDSTNFSFDSLADLEKLNNPIAGGGNVGNVSDEQFNNYQYLLDGSGIYMQANSCNNGSVKYLFKTPSDMDLTNYKIRVTSSGYYKVQCGGTNFEGVKVLKKYGTLPAGPIFTYDVTGTLRGSSGNYQDYPLSLYKNGIIEESLSNLNDQYITSSDTSLKPLASLCASPSISVWQGIFNVGADIATGGIGGSYAGIGVSLPSLKSLVNAQDFNIIDIKYTYTMTLVDNSGTSYGSKSQTFDLVNGTIIDGGDTLTVSSDEVYNTVGGGADYNSHTSDFDENYLGGNASASSGGAGGNSNSNSNIESGAVVINNNPTFNNDSSSSSSSFGSGGLIPFIIGAIAGNNKSSSDSITTMTGANGWLQVISSTWSWIPSQIWTTLITTFTAVIGIIVVAFIISIIIRFIT